jgi:gluconolactonase
MQELPTGSVYPNTMNRSLIALTLLNTLSFAQDTSLHDWLIEGEGWKQAITGYTFVDGLCTDATGNLYFSDVKAGKGIYKTDLASQQTTLLHGDLPGISAMQFGPDGKLYACHNKAQRIIRIDSAGTLEELLTGVKCNDLVVSKDGFLYFTETPTKRIHFINTKDKTHRIADEGNVTRPNGISLSPDHCTLAVSDHGGSKVWAWSIQTDGSLKGAEPYMAMDTPLLEDQSGGKPGEKPKHLPLHKPEALGDGMTTDAAGRWFVTTAVGVQVFDSMGRHSGTLELPTPTAKIVSVEFAGSGHSTLYLAAGDSIWTRKLKTTGIFK